ncbi:MAG: hypothetical protein ACKO3B_04410 [Bacteroidota bacterium]
MDEINDNIPGLQPVQPRPQYTQYFLEFIFVFLAVFLGFLADGYREEQSEKRQAFQLARSFYEELQHDSAAVVSKINGRIKKEKAIEYMIAVLRDSNLNITSKELSIKFIWATTTRTPIIFTPRIIVLEQLKNSDGLRFFTDRQIHKLVGEYSVAIDYINTRQILEAQVYKDYIEPIMVKHMDYEFQHKLFINGIFDRLAQYETSDEYIPFRLSQISSIDRQGYINALSYYHTNNIKSTRLIPFADYARINAELLAELRKEFALNQQ